MSFFTQLTKKSTPQICIVAILKEEDAFVHEWIAYHRLLGVDHFFLYDNDPRLPLKELIKPFADFVTVIEWLVDHTNDSYKGTTKQEKAYQHSIANHIANYDWVSFIDIDEFIVLKKHASLPDFLSGFARYDCIVLNWMQFGHNGYYDTPPGLVTELLTKRQANPFHEIKLITKVSSLVEMRSAHDCVLRRGAIRVDANKKKTSYKRSPDKMYPGIADVACINHYSCRSFSHWMSRHQRGDVGAYPIEYKHEWRYSEEGNLRKFVSRVAKEYNEKQDLYMQKYASQIKQFLQEYGIKPPRTESD